jgi:hypothetical protein
MIAVHLAIQFNVVEYRIFNLILRTSYLLLSVDLNNLGVAGSQRHPNLEGPPIFNLFVSVNEESRERCSDFLLLGSLISSLACSPIEFLCHVCFVRKK